MKAEQIFERCLIEPAAPPPVEATQRPGERYVLQSRRVDLEAAGCLVHFAGPLTVEVVGGHNVYVRTDSGRRGVLRLRELAAHWRRAATPPPAAPPS